MSDLGREARWLLRDKYDGAETAEFRADLERLQAGEPLAYVIGWVPFAGAKIFLDSRPLIPRPETEYWTELAIEEARAAGGRLKALDLCAGSGCVGVALARSVPCATVDFVEVEPAHHATIAKNCRENGIAEERIRILGGDLFANAGEDYDLILSNPPYVDAALGRVDANVAANEPPLALYGGEGGTAVLRRIIAEAPARLSPGGSLYLEHEPEQADEIAALLPRSMQRRDQYGLVRYTTYRNT